MAYTNHFQYAEEPPGEANASAVGGGIRPGSRASRRAQAAELEPDSGFGRLFRRGAGSKARVQRKASRAAQRQQFKEATQNLVDGWPALEGLAPILCFLAIPGLLVLAITVSGTSWPAAILYPIALALGLVVAISALKGVELVLAVMLIYLPFSKVFVVPIAPGVNGTNMLILLGLFAAVLRSLSKQTKLTQWPPGTTLVVAFGVITSLSAITISLIPGGRTYFLYTEVLSYKAWVDQFIFYFILLICIRDIETAKRCVVYMMLGSILVVLYSVPEMLDKMGRSTIDKSRIMGPHLQSNNFGGFVSYTLLPLIAIFVIYIKDLRAWLLTPYFLISAKVLISTFSRGAYLAMAVGGLLAGWYKGRGFLMFWATLGLTFLLVFPSLMPEAIVARMDSLKDGNASSSAPATETLDKSSSIRLIMWRAGAQMVMESPVLGKGFKGFPYLKEDYTEISVKESDPHSMYLYIGSQMGLPALALFLIILLYSFNLGRMLSRDEKDKFVRAIGIGGASATACYAVVGIFGSRAVSLNFTVYFWTYLVIMQVIKQKRKEERLALTPQRERTNAFIAAKAANSPVNEQDYSDDDDSSKPPTGRRKPPRKTRTSPRGAAAHKAATRQNRDTSRNTGGLKFASDSADPNEPAEAPRFGVKPKRSRRG